ncbi:MAG: YdeI/OmpD-associated family protein [Crocinitomicaceae bacterium]
MEYSFKGTLGNVQDSSLMWNYRIVVPDDIVEPFKDTDKRIICTVNESEQVHCALMSAGDGTYYIMMNAGFRKKNKLSEGDEVFVQLKKDESKYGMAVPDFFEELCFQDPEADKYFHALTAGKQRTLLHLIGKVKSEQKKLEKSLIIFDYLKSVNGNLDFKELNEALKNNRFKK